MNHHESIRPSGADNPSAKPAPELSRSPRDGDPRGPRRRGALATPTAVVAGIAVLGLVAVGTIASAADPQQTFTGCLKSGKLSRVAIGTTPSKPCPKRAKQISWNAFGPAGAKGEPGATGLTGPSGPTGAAGPSGVGGYEHLRVTSAFDSNAVKIVWVDCPLGKTAISGGYEIFASLADPARDRAPIAVTISRNAAGTTPYRWVVKANEIGASDYTFAWSLDGTAACVVANP